MTPEQIINASLASRGMMPMDGGCYCSCCDDSGLDRDDMASTVLYHQSHLDALADKYGGPVCAGCAEIAALCDNCDTPTDVDDLHHCTAEDMRVCVECLCQTFVSDAYGYRNSVKE